MFKRVKTKFILAILGMISLFFSGIAQATVYEIDPNHSTIGFAAKHLQVSTTRGNFTDYKGTIDFNPEDLTAFKADVTIQAGSINTQNEKRDNHLRSGDFFEAEQYPTITFTSTRIAESGGGYSILGELTIKGVTKTISIPVEIAGPVASPMGSQVIGIKGQTVIDRQDFGVSWSKTMDNGGLVVSDVVDIIIELEAGAK